MRVFSIINITPDSFLARSRAVTQEQIAQAALAAVEQGADVLDIGAYSTRPGHSEVTEEEELRRLDFALCVVRANCPHVALSVDTFRSGVVARLYDKFGAFIVNDVQGAEVDGAMLETVGRLGLEYVMMSNLPTMEAIAPFFERQIARARQCGVRDIIVDPGFGFGKSAQQNFALLREMSGLRRFGCPILAGISHKRMIYNTLGVASDEAQHGTTALHWAALSGGATILRAHDTLNAKQVITLYETFINSTSTSLC